MRKIWKKWICLVLTLSAVLSVAVPAVSATEPEEYVFPEFSKPVYLGEPLTGEMSITEDVELINHNGKDYLITAAKGGSLYVFKLTDFMETYDPAAQTDPLNWIHDQESMGDIMTPRGLVGDSTGKFYVVGGSNNMYIYDFHAGSGYSIGLPHTRGSVNDICIDRDDNLYIALTPNTPELPAQVLKVDTRNGYKITTVYETMEMDYTSAVVCGDDGMVYVVGTSRGNLGSSEIHKFDPATGEKKGDYFIKEASFILYLSWIDGVVFAGNSGNIGDGMVALDCKTMERIDVGVTNWIMGYVTEPRDGVSYMMCNNAMVYRYDLATRKCTMIPELVGVGLNLRIREPYLEDVDFNGITGTAMITMAASGATPTLLSLEGQGFTQFPEMIEGAISPAQVRTIVPGIPGVMTRKTYNDGTVSLTEAEVAVYVGGFLTPRVASYCPDQDEDIKINNKALSQGHAQTDAAIVYKDKVYFGCYSGGFIVEFDPATEEVRDLIPNGLYKEYQQVRLHALAAGDDKIFFGTIPTTGVLGGVIGWYDLKTDELTVIDKPLGEESIISLAYDEENHILYAAGSTKAGNNTVTTAEEAHILVWDVANNSSLGTYSVRNSENPYSDMVWDLDSGDKLPYYIAGLERDPDTGKFWGLVGRTLFTFRYDPAVKGLRIHEEWGDGGKSIYTASSAMHWFSRPMMFDGKGHLYVAMESAGLIRFDTDNTANNIRVSGDGTRIMAMGSDGNIYYGAEGEKLYMIALNRVDIVKAMIDGTEPKDYAGVAEARMAYTALTGEEKTEFGEKYEKKLTALEGAARIFVQVDAERVIEAIDSMGAITVTSAGELFALRTAYDALTEEGRGMVTNYDDLVAAENAYASISARTAWGDEETLLVGLGGIYNPNANGVLLQNIKYGHTAGSVWEYATGTAKFNGRDHIQMNFGGEGTNYLGIKVKVLETGLYDMSIDTLAYNGAMGAVYMFPTAGLSDEELYVGIQTEVTQCIQGTEHYVGSVDYTLEATQSLGKWQCDAPGEYIMVFGMLQLKDGAYARFKAVTLTKRDPVTDPTVEMAKTRINAIGKVTKDSGTAINEARITYDALTDAQREQIYAPCLERIEKEYAQVAAKAAADEAAAAVVEIQINAIGEVTLDSGDAIRTARDAYDALTRDQQKLVKNEKVLKDAEKAYKALTADTGSDDTAQKPDNTVTVVVIIAAVAAALIAAAVITMVLLKKKKHP